jgi:hypothetical protein
LQITFANIRGTPSALVEVARLFEEGACRLVVVLRPSDFG